LVTGSDILFFWVARMLFQCSDYDKTVSLKKVLFHGIVRDKNGKKMSKSLNNGIDPLQVIEEHGADTLRMYLISNANCEAYDVNFNEEKMLHCKLFINKI
jgi:valyl-tRNA synthetase